MVVTLALRPQSKSRERLSCEAQQCYRVPRLQLHQHSVSPAFRLGKLDELENLGPSILPVNDGVHRHLLARPCVDVGFFRERRRP
jgi:hypothetical protein